MEHASSFYQGKVKDYTKLPNEFCEHIFACEYGWSLEYIRKLRPVDFNKHMRIFLIKYNIKAAIDQRKLF